MSKSNIVPLSSDQPAKQESPNRLSFTLEEMLKEFNNGAVPRCKYWRELITALYDTANHVVTGVTAVADVRPDNVGNIPLLPKDIDAPAMVRMDGADANTQQTNQDVFGRSLFYGDACKVVHQYGAYYEVLAGTAYVAGIRFFYPGMQELLIDEVPNKVWIDVSWPSDPMKQRKPIVIIYASQDDLRDYLDEYNIIHFIECIGYVAESSQIDDVRESSVDINMLRKDQAQPVTHMFLSDAVSDDNSARDYIKIGNSELTQYKKVKSQVDADFIDVAGNYFKLIKNRESFSTREINENNYDSDIPFLTSQFNTLSNFRSYGHLLRYPSRDDQEKAGTIDIPTRVINISRPDGESSFIAEQLDLLTLFDANGKAFIPTGNIVNADLVNHSLGQNGLLFSQSCESLFARSVNIGSIFCSSSGNTSSNISSRQSRSKVAQSVNLASEDCDSFADRSVNIGSKLSYSEAVNAVNVATRRAQTTGNDSGQLATDTCSVGIGARAVFDPIVIDGVITQINVIKGGSGYTNESILVIQDKNETGSGAEATLNVVDGIIDSVAVTSGGRNYSSGITLVIRVDSENTFQCSIVGSAGSAISGRNSIITSSLNSVVKGQQSSSISCEASDVDANVSTSLSCSDVIVSSNRSVLISSRNCEFSATNAIGGGYSSEAVSKKNENQNINWQISSATGEARFGLTRPMEDSQSSLGTITSRWSDIFVVDEVIQTPDEQEILNSRIPNSWLDAADNIKQIRFQRISEIKKYENGKRQAPRWHIGYGAQTVYKECLKFGIENPWEISFMCKDALVTELEDGTVKPLIDEKTGKQKERWGLRISELNTLKIAAIERKLANLENK